MPYLLFDVAIVLILAFFVWRGVSKGFVLTLCGLVAVIIAVVGANFLAGALAPKVGAALEPRFAQMIEEQLTEAIQSTEFVSPDGGVAQLPDQVPLAGVLDVLRGMGLYQDLIDKVDQAVSQGLTGAAASAAAAVAAAIAQAAAYMILFLVSFVLILILWRLLSHALDLVTRLPVLNGLNKLGGAAIGLVKGALILFVAAWLLRLSGKLIPEEAVAQTYLLKFFMTTNPISLLTGI